MKRMSCDIVTAHSFFPTGNPAVDLLLAALLPPPHPHNQSSWNSVYERINNPLHKRAEADDAISDTLDFN